jgi:hypothetical protein
MESESTTDLPTASGEKKQVRLVDIPVNSQQDAFQLIIMFLNLAQKRGVFTIDESAKLWECIKMFQQ